MAATKLELEAEVGRLFIELERAREFQAQALQRIQQLREELKRLEELPSE